MPVCQPFRQSSQIPLTPVRPKPRPTHTAANRLAQADLTGSVTLQAGAQLSPYPLRTQHPTARQVRCTLSPCTQQLCQVVLTSATLHSTGNQTRASRNLQNATPPVTPAPGHAQPSDSPSSTLGTSTTERMPASPSDLAAGRSNQPTPLRPHSSSPPRFTCHGRPDSRPAPPNTQSTNPVTGPTEAPASDNSCSKTHLSPTPNHIRPLLHAPQPRSPRRHIPLAPARSPKRDWSGHRCHPPKPHGES